MAIRLLELLGKGIIYLTASILQPLMANRVRFVGFTYVKQVDSENYTEIRLFQENNSTFYICLHERQLMHKLVAAYELGTSIDLCMIKKFVDKKISHIDFRTVKGMLKEQFKDSVWYFVLR